MRSSELATLAGVSVRALRHYHHIGILDEPTRNASGYRDYGVHDLVQVLRIKRLAALGLPLQTLPTLLHSPDDNSDSVLEQLDLELQAKIDSLSAQRAVIARIRREHSAPDLPPELARSLSAFATAGLSPRFARLDREQAILLAHLVDESGLASIAALYDQLAEPDRIQAYSALNSRFDALAPETDAATIESLIDDTVAAIEEIGSEAVSLELEAAVESRHAPIKNPQHNPTHR
ncbi:MAG: MerR family transcriptional regulator, partial [Demequina sp.]